MSSGADYLLKEATLVNEGKTFSADVLIKKGRIERIDNGISVAYRIQEMDAGGMHLLPGMIDDQVHFREPGLTHKGDLASESRAAVAGGITSFMEMPNTEPQALTVELLEQKYALGKEKSRGNYSFFMGTGNHNLEEVLKTNPRNVCGVKIFMGSSTGEMLVDSVPVLESIFAECTLPIATHCEDEHRIKTREREFVQKYGKDLSMEFHPQIRDAEACYLSSSLAINLAKKYGSRLHVLHISTAREMELFFPVPNNLGELRKIDLEGFVNVTLAHLPKKKITCEACLHHLWFSDADYARLGSHIKWNPAVKSSADRTALWAGLLEGRIDVLATDHAPHTAEEKQKPYLQCPSGGPLVQHALLAWLEAWKHGMISLEEIALKTAHAPAVLFQIKDRGFIREGYWADLVLVKEAEPWKVSKSNILYKCGWSPFEGQEFHHRVDKTFVNGQLAWDGKEVRDEVRGMRLEFDRPSA